MSVRPLHLRGAALLLTLWCVAIVAVSVVLLARMVESDVEGESLRVRRFEARELALTGLAHGLNPNLPKASELLHQSVAGGTYSVEILSEAGRLNINHLLKEPDLNTLTDLLEYWGVPEADVRSVVDALADWTDPDDLRRLNGAERDQLKGQREYSIPLNRDFQSVGEMRRVRGMDVVAQYQPDWARYFSVLSGKTIDLQDTSPDVLRAVAGFTGGQVGLLQDFRNGGDKTRGTTDDRYLQSLEEAVSRAGLNAAQAEALATHFSLNTEPTRIESVGRVGGVEYRISAVVDRTSAGPALHWEEE